MKKIIHVAESFAAGVYSVIADLTNSLADEYEVVIIYSLREETPKDFKKDFHSDIKFIKADMCRGLNPYENLKAYFNLKKILKKEKPDIIHLHSSKAGFLGRIACRMNGFDMNNVYYNPHGFSFLQLNESKIRRSLFYLLEKLASRCGGTIVACSKGEYEEALKLSNNCININNGIDLKKIDEIIIKNKLCRESYKNNSRITIGTTGRICHQKNPRLFNQIAESLPEYDFVWIGHGELKNQLIAPNIKITGWLNKQQVIEQLLKLDIFIMTSLWEGMPVSLLEAMYLKTPVIVSNVIGNRDVIQNEVNGYVVNDLPSYVQAIDKLITSDTEREKLIEEAARDVNSVYTKKIMIKKYKRCYLNKGDMVNEYNNCK
jgi:glycosyltransferase involved in cell wall biosynthesis